MSSFLCKCGHRQTIKRLPPKCDKCGWPEKIEAKLDEKTKLLTTQGPSHLEEALVQQISLLGLPKPVREYRFHPVRGWLFDLAWVDIKLAAEVEGMVWAQGRHTRGSGFIDDCEKYNTAALMGWVVLRIPGDWIGRMRRRKRMPDVWEDSAKAVTLIEKALTLLKGASSYATH